MITLTGLFFLLLELSTAPSVLNFRLLVQHATGRQLCSLQKVWSLRLEPVAGFSHSEHQKQEFIKINMPITIPLQKLQNLVNCLRVTWLLQGKNTQGGKKGVLGFLLFVREMQRQGQLQSFLLPSHIASL